MKKLLIDLAYKANRAQKSKDNIPEEEKLERYRQLKKELMEHKQQEHVHKKRVPTFGGNEEELVKFEDKSINGTE